MEESLFLYGLIPEIDSLVNNMEINDSKNRREPKTTTSSKL